MDRNIKPDKINLERGLKPAGAYIDSLSGFADLLGTIRQAENAAKEMLEETSQGVRGAPKSGPPPAPPVPPAPPSPETPETAKKGDGADSPNPQGEANTGETPAEAPTVEQLLEKLDALVGLDNIKRNVKSLINYVKIRKLREENSLPNPPLSLHMVFMGNPGTGKTTVARILSELYKAIGILSKGHLIEVDRSGLVAGFVGQTALKTSEVVKSAFGGILFIDEAYSLTPDVGTGNDFGREAVETLLKLMEDNRDDLIVIVAGYSRLMGKFISSNPGLESRFNRYFVFEDYNSDEMFEIFSILCSKSEYNLTDDAKSFAREFFCDLYATRDSNFGNARDVRNYFENIVSVHSDRVSALETHTREDLTTVFLEDLEKAAKPL